MTLTKADVHAFIRMSADINEYVDKVLDPILKKIYKDHPGEFRGLDDYFTPSYEWGEIDIKDRDYDVWRTFKLIDLVETDIEHVLLDSFGYTPEAVERKRLALVEAQRVYEAEVEARERKILANLMTKYGVHEAPSAD